MTETAARRVVVTGLGATTPVGGDVPSTWQTVLDGVSGARSLPDGWSGEHPLPVTFACSIAVPPSEKLTTVERKRLDPSGQFAMIAAREAWADAGTPDVDPERLAVAMASGIGGVWTLLDNQEIARTRGPRRVLPMTVPMLMPNGPAAAVGLEFGAKAGVHTPVSACASGSEAQALAVDIIRAGRADVVIAGGTEAAIHPLTMAGFCAMQALSTRNETPTTASRPYDTSRDGFVMGEGAAALVLESLEHAQARGARIYGEIVGSGLTSDAHHIAAPDPVGAGAVRAMKLALKDAGADPGDLVHVNAHATSTPAGDVAEAIAITGVLGRHAEHVAVSATKSITGHLLGASGALESVLTLLALHHRLAPPTINVEDLDPAVTLDVVRKDPRPLPAGGLALNNSFGFGGHNVSLVFRGEV